VCPTPTYFYLYILIYFDCQINHIILTLPNINKMYYVTPEESNYYITLKPNEVHKADAFTLIPSRDGRYPGDKWEDVIYLSNSILDEDGAVKPTEYVYILANQSVPNMVKIGMTTKTPVERAKEISAVTGVAVPWQVVYEYKCYNSLFLEQEVHQYFKAQRVNDKREMFTVDKITAQLVIEQLGYKYSTAFWADKLKLIYETQTTTNP